MLLICYLFHFITTKEELSLFIARYKISSSILIARYKNCLRFISHLFHSITTNDLSIYLSIYLCVCLSMYVCLSLCLSVYLMQTICFLSHIHPPHLRLGIPLSPLIQTSILINQIFSTLLKLFSLSR